MAQDNEHDAPEHSSQSHTAVGKPYTKPAEEQVPERVRKPGFRGYREDLSMPLSRTDSYRNGHLTHVAFLSLAVLTLITFLGNFTQLQLSAALPTIVSEFGITVTTGQWLTSIFQLVMGVMVPLTAFLTRRFSTRQIVLTSMVVFTIGSLCAWLAPSFPLLLTGRLLEAIGTGVMWPVLQITVFSIFPLDKRGVAMGTVGMAMSVAPAIGPTIGGLQTDFNGWRSIFMSLTIIGAAALILAFFVLHNFGGTDKLAKADFFSVTLSVIGFGGLMYGFTNIQAYPFTHPVVWVPMLVGAAGIVWFILRQLKNTKRFEQGDSDQPALLNVNVFCNRGFRTGTIIAAMSFFSFSSLTVILPLFIQDCRGYSATISGLVMLPGAIGQAIAQFIGGRALDRFGARPVNLAGTTMLVIGTICMTFMINPLSPIWSISICQFVRQLGIGCVLMPVTTWSLNCLEPKYVSAGSAVTNTVRQIAGAIGAPVLILIMSTLTAYRESVIGTSAQNAILANIFGIRWALTISSGISVLMLITVIVGVRGYDAGSASALARRAIEHVHPHGHVNAADAQH